MLRPRSTPKDRNSGAHVTPPNSSDGNYKAVAPKSLKQILIVGSTRYGTTILFFLSTLILGMFVQKENHTIDDLEPMLRKEFHLPVVEDENLHTKVPPEFSAVVSRAMLHQKHCQAIGLVEHEDHSGTNNHTAHLPHFGILNAIEKYDPSSHDKYPYTCQLPPENECDETQFTVIFMAYNPDRLKKMYNQIFKMVSDAEFKPLIAEVIVVWNGERHVDETNLGKALVDLAKEYPVRISYPLKAGFPNDLMNRYHPRLEVKTKAIMYYDDDGPFYSYKATLGGFELWKRNANAQIGAMARKLDYSPRQRDERQSILNGPGDRFFVSSCPTDKVRYNFNEFANFGANMVLPSGSFLHSNYLCFLWHPVFAEIREYVQQHPVNPDDGTVSIIVSQLAGRAPKVYSRRINESKEEQNNNGDANQRRLLQLDEQIETDIYDSTNTTNEEAWLEEEEEMILQQRQQRRRLMDGIDWDHGGGHNKKHFWGQLRSDAANSLVRYFGSMNSGSVGWCYGTKYQVGEYCKPEMARVGQLPWLKPDHTPRDTCP